MNSCRRFWTLKCKENKEKDIINLLLKTFQLPKLVPNALKIYFSSLFYFVINLIFSATNLRKRKENLLESCWHLILVQWPKITFSFKQLTLTTSLNCPPSTKSLLKLSSPSFIYWNSNILNMKSKWAVSEWVNSWLLTNILFVLLYPDCCLSALLIKSLE